MEDKLFELLEYVKSDNLWFIRKAYGGYSPCIAGKPLSSSQNGKSCLPNCVGGAYAYECYLHDNKELKLGFDNKAGKPYSAHKWWNCKDGWIKSSKPVLGSVVCWRNPLNTGGHVAVVTKVYDDGSFNTLESSYNHAEKRWQQRHYNKKGQKVGLILQGFKVSPYYRFIEEIKDEKIDKGDLVKIKKNGYKRYVKEYREQHQPNPYLLWTGRALTGWYKEEELELIEKR